MKKNIISFLQLEYSFVRNVSDASSMVLSDSSHEISAEKFYYTAVSFAEKLYNKGIWNQPIVIRAEHRLETLILYLAVLLSGNYYVPLPEDLPEEKVQKILGQLHTRYVYTCEDIRYTDKSPAQDLLEGLEEVRKGLPEDAILYVIFTSGSTGEPKGIVKSHRSMIAFLESYQKVFAFSEKDVLANQTPFCFDASAKDFYLMLQHRMDFHIIDGAMFFRPLEILHLLNERKVTVIQWVPSALSMLSQLKTFDKEVPLYLRKVFFVGESFPAKQLKYWQNYLPDTEFVNLYAYYSLSRLLLTRAGIPNLMITRYPAVPNHHHWWNLAYVKGGWYHFDTTPRRLKGHFCLLTDSQLRIYERRSPGTFRYANSAYPKRAMKTICSGPF